MSTPPTVLDPPEAPATQPPPNARPGGRVGRDLARILKRLTPPGAWIYRGACRSTDPEVFFTPADESQAKDVCRRCAVIDQCLAWALDSRDDNGVFGGLSEQERAQLTGDKPGTAGRRAKALRHAQRLAAIAHTQEQRMIEIERAQAAARTAQAAAEPKQRTVPGVLTRAAQVNGRRRRGCPVAPAMPPGLVYHDDPWIGQRFKVRISLAPLEPGAGDERKPLSTREAEILDLIADGLSNKQIGAKLGLSPLTVKSHKARIAEHLGACGESSHCVALGYAYGYLRPSPQPPGQLVAPGPRQLEVLLLLPLGLSNSEIGERLNRSVDTVKSHIAVLLKLYGARNRAHLVDIALRTGLFVAVLDTQGPAK